ncbi:MAG: hypothetical protein M9897_03780 [Brumimicrobium sp.]|nr:hypothetical protein [Brumimicrobium sp.]
MFKNVRFHIVALLVLFVISTSGLTVYKHFCAFKGVSYNISLLSSDDSCKKSNSKQVTHTCCVSTPSQDLKFEKNCCNEEVDIFQIHTDLNTFHQLDFITNFVNTYPIEIHIPVEKSIQSFLAETVPIPIPLYKRLSLVQSYLI